MLGIEGSKYFVKLWAGNLPLDDYKMSPINGNLEGLGHITMTIGTKETLYPDAVKFHICLMKRELSMNSYLVIVCFIFILYSLYQSVNVS